MTRNPDDVKAGVAATQQQIAEACARVGRDPSGVEIVAAVKYLAIEDLPLLHAAGIRRVGENRTDQLIAKQDAHGELFTWDFIGHLQSRKVKEIVGRVELIHSLFTESKPSPIAISGMMKFSAATKEMPTCSGSRVKMRRNR